LELVSLEHLIDAEMGETTGEDLFVTNLQVSDRMTWTPSTLDSDC